MRRFELELLVSKQTNKLANIEEKMPVDRLSLGKPTEPKEKLLLLTFIILIKLQRSLEPTIIEQIRQHDVIHHLEYG